MRVLFIHPGPDRTEAALAAGLAHRGIDLTVLTRQPGRHHLFAPGHKVQYLPMRIPWDISAIHLIRRTLIRGHFDTVHIFSGKACFPTLLALAGLRKPRVFWYRGAIVKPSRLNPLDRIRYFGGAIDCFVANCEAVRISLLKAGIHPHKALTIYKGHDPRWYDDQPLDLRNRLRIPPHAFVAGTLANVRKAKGLQYLIRAAPLLPPSPRPFAIVIVGRDRQRMLSREVHRLRRRSPKNQCPVYLAGQIPDGFRVLRSLDCFVTPLLQGAFGIDKAVIEAMSQRLPVIATRAAGLPEVVHHQKNGLLIPPASPHAIARAILRLANDPPLARELGLAARNTVAQRLTVHNMVEKTIRTYQRFLSPAGDPMLTDRREPSHPPADRRLSFPPPFLRKEQRSS